MLHSISNCALKNDLAYLSCGSSPVDSAYEKLCSIGLLIWFENRWLDWVPLRSFLFHEISDGVHGKTEGIPA